jgi:hypothetical protein
MLYLRIELWPKGQRDKSRLLHEAVIANDGTGNANRGNYKAHLSRKGGFGKGSNLPKMDCSNIWKSFEVKSFHRKVKNSWHLLKNILEQM